ncbi:MAG TPA: outer membrane beta-barrel protein, partial [Methylocystis sp.]|nr:outer membrane beta-barrel protein [Methylocystis sp.]
MALMFSRARVSAIAAIAAALCGRAAVAAGMPFLSAPEPAPATPPVEIGSGWYLRGDVGYESMTAPIITTDLTTLASRINNASGGIGVGFQFNQWFRADLTLDRSVNRQQGSGASMYCPYGTLVNVPNVDINGTLQTVEAYLYNPAETCTPLVNAHINRTSLIANGYFDLGNWWGVTPYVGAGIGVSYLQTSASVNYYENGTGNLWAPNLGVA